MESETVYDYESFTMAVEKGLKLIQTSTPTPTPPLPTVPVVYAAVPGPYSDAKPALVPLQIRLVSVKILAVADAVSAVSHSQPSSSPVRVRFRASWLLDNCFSGSLLFLAVPVGHQGCLVSYEIKSDYPSQPLCRKVEFDANYKPLFQNIYLVSLPPVQVVWPDMQISVMACYDQDFSAVNHELGFYSLRVPLSIPTYVNLRPWDMPQTQKIRLILESRGVGAITDFDIASHPLIDLITDEKRRVLLLESREYSNKDLNCVFRVTSPTMDQSKLFSCERLFIMAVEEGLKLTCGTGELSSPPLSMLPSSPVLYALVSNLDIMDIETISVNRVFQPPALVPLQMSNLSVKVNVEPNSYSLRVQFKGKWSIHCIKKGNTCPLILAVPVGSGGCLLRYEVHVPSDSPTVLKTEEFTATDGPLFHNLYLVSVPACEGGVDVCVRFSYIQDVFRDLDVFSFTVPLSVPNYVSQIGETSSGKEKIRVTLECKDTGTITKCDVPSHHLLELIAKEKMRVLLKESSEFSEKDLTCSFMVTW